MENNTKIEEALKEIKEYQEIINQGQEQIAKITLNIQNMISGVKSEDKPKAKRGRKSKEKQEIKEEKKPVTINDFKSLYYLGEKIIDENPDEIVLQCTEDTKTKSTQNKWDDYSETYNLKFDVSGNKPKGKDKIEWASKIDYKGNVIPFKGTKKILKKA